MSNKCLQRYINTFSRETIFGSKSTNAKQLFLTSEYQLLTESSTMQIKLVTYTD